MKAIPVPLPPGCEMSRNPASHFLDDARDDDGNGTSWANKLRNIAQVKVIRSEVMIGVEAHNSIEELVGKGQAMSFGIDGKYLLLFFGGANPLPVVAGADPQIRCPHLKLEFLSQKNRCNRLPAAQVHYPRARLKRHDLAERFCQPERIGTHQILQHPQRIIAGRAWKLVKRQPGRDFCCRMFHSHEILSPYIGPSHKIALIIMST